MSETTCITKVNLLKRQHAVILPGYAEREEIAAATWTVQRSKSPRAGHALLRIYAACIGLSTRLGRESGVDYGDCSCDPMVYGGRVYGWLREQGATAEEVSTAGIEILKVVLESLFPREVEVEAEKKDSVDGGETAT